MFGKLWDPRLTNSTENTRHRTFTFREDEKHEHQRKIKKEKLLKH